MFSKLRSIPEGMSQLDALEANINASQRKCRLIADDAFYRYMDEIPKLILEYIEESECAYISQGGEILYDEILDALEHFPTIPGTEEKRNYIEYQVHLWSKRQESPETKIESAYDDYTHPIRAIKDNYQEKLLSKISSYLPTFKRKQ